MIAIAEETTAKNENLAALSRAAGQAAIAKDQMVGFLLESQSRAGRENTAHLRIRLLRRLV